MSHLKMNYIAKNLTYLLSKHNLNAYQLQDASGIAQSTTFRIINGETESPSQKTVSKYASFFKYDVSDLMFKDLETELGDGDNFKRLQDTQVRQVPVLNFVQAGKFCEYHDGAIADEYEPISGDYGPNVYWVIIEGLSMVPDFQPKEYVLIDPDTQPIPGDFVVALKHGEKKVTFKKWRPRGFDENGVEYFQLVPSNPDFPTIDSRREPFDICGVALEQKRKLR
ncbi:LexA family transcriptional regulator [Psychrobacter pygoscelis]|uniref:LexA family transcriptional regulator n=1 Tax=Psychrobacter pygoscelis TaxID=2488563 RepID=UPI0013F49BAD|nr:LexA family transcriptional regulator [Psychrobacter pygoscelis]